MLTPEDTLKLNVLIATCDAIRIDVYKLIIVGLTPNKKEQTIILSPTGDSSKYIEAVQKLLVTQILGGMGGYPSYLKRWSRMGQVESANLKSLLKIGNIEAVVAVSNSQNLNDEVLDLVWWCATNTDQQAEIGRFLLTRNFVVKHEVGKQIADYLLEFLPFTDDTTQLIDTTNLLLQDDLITQSAKDRLWKQGQRKTAFLVGFIERNVNNLPNNDNTIALNSNIKELECVNSEQGQILLKTIAVILKKINQEHVLYRTLEVLGNYVAHPMIQPLTDIQQCQNQAHKIAANLGLEGEKIKARLLLASVSEQLVVSTISAHSLAGSAIRKKLSNVLKPIQDALKLLTTP
ncbi:DsrS [hydrothermal vent metagenome]|uniref:DsrS n=1 Tax=hydrothermal vent metagenome TaxID=652676 RepID=A0A1W1E633_9ZZZZ